MGRRVHIGDIIEFSTTKGFAYAQYTHDHPKLGYLIRVLEPICKSRPVNLEPAVNGQIRFQTFFPLQAAVNRGITPIVGHLSVPRSALKFPIFRNGLTDPRTGRVETWWLWDGTKEWRVSKLSSKQRDYPIDGIMNDTGIIELIESDWRPRDYI